MCDGYGDCDDSLSVTWIVVIIVAVIIKIVFWSFVCYRWRRRQRYYTSRTVVVVQPNHTVTRPGMQQPVRAAPVVAQAAYSPQYPGSANAPPAYSAPAQNKYPSAPSQHPSAPSQSPPSYNEMNDTTPLVP